MADIVQATTYILGNEKALNLAEVNLVAPHKDGRKGTGWYRFQIILVVRNEKPAEYRERLGPAKNFTHNQICIPSYLEHTVDELKDMADWIREQPAFDKYELAQVNKPVGKTGTS